jgi:hypothetical protein
MPGQTLIAVVSFLACAVALAAQQKPDYSGEYVLNPQASTLSPAVAAAIQSGGMRVEHREPRFGCRMTMSFGDKPIEYAFEFTTDGREVAGTERGHQTVSSMHWEGDALVFTSQSRGPDSEMTMSWRYELHDGGRRLRAVEQIRGGGRDQDNIWVFERK